MRQYVSGLLFAFVVLLSGGPAWSQFGRYLLDSLPQLSSEDIALIERTARDDMDGKPEGTVLRWQNEKSGNSGTVTLVRRFSREGQECRQLRHDLNLANQRDQTHTTVICRQPDGTWARVPGAAQ